QPVAPRRSLERFGPFAACLGLIGLLCWSAYESLKPDAPVAQDPSTIQVRTTPSAKVAARKDQALGVLEDIPTAEPAPPAAAPEDSEAAPEAEKVADKPGAPKAGAVDTAAPASPLVANSVESKSEEGDA